MKLTAHFESTNNTYVGWIQNTKGLVVEADSLEGVLRELMISLKVKLAYDLGVEIDEFELKVFNTEEEYKEFESKLEKSNGIGSKDINLDMSYA